jgi:fatty-acyl-CoA synthase
MTLMAMMQSVPLGIPHILHRAEQQFGEKKIFSVESGVVHEIRVASWAQRVRRLASVLETLGISAGATVATFAANTQRHLELYYAVPCTGRALHPLNIRLSAEHLRYIVTRADDEVVFVDRGLFAQLWPLADDLPRLHYWVVMDDGSGVEVPRDPRIHYYESLIADARPFVGEFAIQEEDRAAGVCFTSGTTGPPKGVVYSHRAIVLHALIALASGNIGIAERDRVLPIVPMFHASAWGLPYAAVFAGADLVLPGSDLKPSALLSLISELRVTVAAAVPTVWSGMLPLVDEFDLSSLRLSYGGGSATPSRLADEWRERVGIPITPTWGMTELAPTGIVGGRALPLVELRIVDVESGEPLPRDGVAVGELQARGPTVASGYLGDAPGSALTNDGWLPAGDIASIDPRGEVVIRDRLKDLIKSGGEWIPSLQLEMAILSDPAVAEVAVVGRADPRWTERPVAFVVTRPDGIADAAVLLGRLRSLVPTWWLPDDVVYVEELPRTSTGKVAKPELRARL